MNKSVYLIINHIVRPIKGLASHKKGEANNPDNYETFENMILADRVSNSNLRSASVVIDLLNGKVVKSRFEQANTETFRAYVDRYQKEIGEALKDWGLRDPDNFKKLIALRDATKATAPETTEEVPSDETNPD